MRMFKNKLSAQYFVCILAGAMLSHCAVAQTLSPELQKNKWLTLAEEQFQQGNYALANQSATQYLTQTDAAPVIKPNDLTARAQYYLTVGRLKLNTTGCTDSAVAFINATPNTAYKERTAFALAEHFFAHNQLASAIPYYEMADIASLSNKELIDERFELAYCYFNNRQFDKAEPLFASIKELPQGKYYNAGNYYYGLLAYNENNYKDALKSFDRIKSLPQYHSIVPYYIAEIYYFMGERDRSLNYAMKLIQRSDKLYYDNELHLLAAQCLFEEKRYGDALPYFEEYYNKTDKIRKEDLYEMAYCYYRVDEWKEAINKFKPLSNTRDSLGQSAMYLLGDCYLKTNDKKSARNAFGICGDMPFNPEQQEASILLYAKLSYEMGYEDNALDALKNLLTNFPRSKYRDEAKTVLSDLLIKTSNYAEALKQLEDVSNKDMEYWKVYQKVAYGFAMQQYQYENYTTAYKYLGLSLEHPENDAYTAAAYFWKGQLAYRLHLYADAITYSQGFLDHATDYGAIQHISPAATRQHANLNMGYAAMGEDQYAAAQTYFSNAKQVEYADTTSGLVATIREADAVFMQKDYEQASKLYDKIIAANGPEADYARLQEGIILGLEGKKKDKIAILQTVINTPASKYANNARYELAGTYIDNNKYQAAINTLLPLTTAFDARNLASKAWMKIGFCYQQTGNTAKAIDAYKHIITEYEGSDDRGAALDALKSLYIESGQPAAYTQLLKDNNLPSADSSSLDSTYYAAAEAQFANGKLEKAVEAFTQYLLQYPNGIFTTKAHYYRAESNYHLKHYDDALTDYDAVLKGSWSEFSENSAMRAGAIAYDNKDYNKAADYYQQLRNSAMGADNLQQAYIGLMKSNFNLNKDSLAIAYADTLLTIPNLNDASMNMAQLYKAKVLQQNNKQEDALNIYNQLEGAKDGAVAAESRYHIAEIYFNLHKVKEAETAANKSIRNSGGYDYWIVKSYILLSDILTKEKDYFNAKATLQSIVKHCKIPELKEEATRKLEEVKKLDKHHSKLEE